MEEAMKKQKTGVSVIMEDCNATVGTKNYGKTAIIPFEVWETDQPVRFAEENRLSHEHSFPEKSIEIMGIK